ncbi:potassium voltage-gated channel subfamily G member 2 [Ailuropoda melanoleuca]|uniref:potassium voltage-gated channel subfamily G member 2 n=1 Tax=Ailuropoda melanoleuca TaxID=9646 RepID=UPI001494E16B|nr:potassium voltage-gated channel subfamily G member 2 [Ailuropoda melanoleuca]
MPTSSSALLCGPESRRRDHPGIAVWEGSVDTETLQGRRGRCVQPWLRTAVTLRATLLLKLLAVTPSELLNWEATADDGPVFSVEAEDGESEPTEWLVFGEDEAWSRGGAVRGAAPRPPPKSEFPRRSAGARGEARAGSGRWVRFHGGLGSRSRSPVPASDPSVRVGIAGAQALCPEPGRVPGAMALRPEPAGGRRVVIINVGGCRVRLAWAALARCPLARLERLRACRGRDEVLRVCDDYDAGRDEFFFDRSPCAFRAIVALLRAGKLRLLRGPCALAFRDELAYWGHRRGAPGALLPAPAAPPRGGGGRGARGAAGEPGGRRARTAPARPAGRSALRTRWQALRLRVRRLRGCHGGRPLPEHHARHPRGGGADGG